MAHPISLPFTFLIVDDLPNTLLVKMNNFPFRFQVGEFVEVQMRSGNHRVGWIFSVTEETLSVTWWTADMTWESNPKSFFLPKILIPSHEMDVIEKLPLSSIILMCNGTEVSNFNVCFIYGMAIMHSTFVDCHLPLSFQSITHIIFHSISQISIELQHKISNKQGNQFTYAS
jgi:hypothetical protein